jgi:mRNA deadenylase 3'-5' endonuclease subunit Ccr4
MQDYSGYPITTITDEMKDVNHKFHTYDWVTAKNCVATSDENVATISIM